MGFFGVVMLVSGGGIAAENKKKLVSKKGTIPDNSCAFVTFFGDGEFT